MLKVTDLAAYYGGSRVLHGVDLVASEGRITTILGANGAGKTTLLRAISGLVRATGSIQVGGIEVLGQAASRMAALGIAHVPDNRGTFSGLSVEENLRLGAYRNNDDIRPDMETVLGYFPRLRERFRQQSGTLSGGEQQMLAIGRALMLRPRLLLLDEPSFGLAPVIIGEIFEIIRRLNTEQKVTVLLVEQNARLALEIADHAYLMETGRSVKDGPAAMLGADDSIRRSYLGH